MAKKQIRDYVFSPGVAGAGTLKVLGKVELDQILLITNTTANQFLYNFSDATLPISVVFTETTDGSDPDFPYANTLSNGVTTVTFQYDTTAYSASDGIQFFVEVDEQTIRPYAFGTDAIERMRFAHPQSMLDADFEYGIQPTKWQSIDLLRNYPSIYEVPGSDIAVNTMTTDASQGSGGIGPSLITVDTELDHQMDVGDPISIKGLDDSVPGFSTAEGSFIIDSVPSATQFKYYSKAKVGSTPATSIKSSFTVLKEAGFYTGAEIGTSPTFTVQTQGANGSFTTKGTTPAGAVTFGVDPTSTLPPIGAPLGGVGVVSGTQVTGVVTTDATLAITDSFVAPVSTINFNDTNAIEIGSALDNGAGQTVFVTNIEGNTATLSSPYQIDKTGNSFVSSELPGSPQNFGNGSSTGFDVIREKGSYTSISIHNSHFYYNLMGTYNNVGGGAGNNAQWNVERIGGGSATYNQVIMANAGANYAVNDTITIPGTNLEGTSPTNDITITIDSVNGDGSIATFSAVGNASALIRYAGTGYAVGEKITVYGNALGGQSPLNDLDLYITAVGGAGEITSFDTIGRGIPSSQTYNSVEASSTSGSGINSAFTVERQGNGSIVATIYELEVAGVIETGDIFRTTIDGTTDYTYTAVSGDGLTEVRNGVLSAINAGAGGVVRAIPGSTNSIVELVALSPGTAFTATAFSEDINGNAADGQLFQATETQVNENSNLTPGYTVTISNPGTGFANSDTITIVGSKLGGTDNTNDLTITITSVDANGAITGISNSGTAVNGGATYINMAANPTAFGAKFLSAISSGAYSPTIAAAGTGYEIGYQFLIRGNELGGSAPTNDMTITVTSVDAAGGITAISSTGTPVSGDSLIFYPSVSISAPTSSNIGTSNTVTYSAIAKILVDFATNHGLVPGDTILSSITSSGNGHSLASGPFYVNEVPTLTSLVYTCRTTGAVDETGLVGKIYPRTDSFYTHRPFDGGVQLGTGSPSHGAQAVRQSKKYIRYQSGKGITYTTGALFAPNYDLRSAVSNGLGVGSIITCVTDDLNHGLQVGAEIRLRGITSTGYNGHYVVASIIDEITFTVISTSVLEHQVAEFGDQPIVSLYKWKGATVRAGAFDDQNGIFIQYDGNQISVGLRSSTYQIAGTVSATPDSNELTGVNTKFTEQLKVGDRIVIRGMCHLITKIDSNSRLYMNPDFRGVSTVTNVKAALTKEIIIPQNEWNIDKADGTGKSGYVTDITKMQMMGFQYSWYGAGFIDWMFRGPSGDFIFLHRLKNNNRNNEAFMRSGNLPVRYEVINEGARDRVASEMTTTQDTMTLEDGRLFPDSGALIVNNEIIRYTNKAGNLLSGLTREATYTNFAGGAQRTYTAGSAIAHTKGTGVVLLSTTATPQINHWGSAFLTDGGFDDDRGYLFSWQEKEVEISTTKGAIFLIRLSPSVSNSVTGDLGERELINRAQLLLKNIEITTQGGSSSQGVIVEGVINPRNFPSDPSTINWVGLNTGGAGGQPSFAQVATGSDVDWEGQASSISAANANNQNWRTTWIVFNRADVVGVQIGWEVTGGDLRGGATLVNIYNYDSSRVWFVFSDATRPGSAGNTTYTFQPLVEAAIPGEQVFSFTASGGGNRDNLDLSELKELTNTPIGGRGTFPNGPDVLAINAYLTSGNAINATLNLRWAEAQA